ncbi:response regulator transcription factor [Ruminococcus sp.]|uniref:response regulator transcription factor n=1 Tax=Ruminococcus sp. TaxID=41978 RepID=UPI0038903003
MLIYILEDDENIREIESYTLQTNGYETEDFDSPQIFYKALADRKPDLIILDIMLPDEDGLTVLKTLKANTAYSEIPVIIISAKTTELDRVKGLDLGAEDYLCKPFGVMELVSRVKARLRKLDNQHTYRYCGIELSDSERTVFTDGEKVELTYKEFELLKLLISKPKTVFAREAILGSVWGYGDQLGRTLDMHINTLRKKLGDKGRYIVTVRNVGYKLEKEEKDEA